MAFSSFRSASTLSVAAIVLLVGGLGVAIFASQQSTENRSHADYNPADPKVGDVVGTGELQTTSGNTVSPGSPGAAVTLSAKPGVTYKVQISGTYQYQRTRTTGSDAGQMTDAEWDDWQQSGNLGCYCRHIGRSKIDINDTQVQSIDFQDQSNPAHVYTYMWTANTDTIKLQVWDTHYHDNVGTLSYTVTVDSVPPPPGCKVDSDCTAPQVCEVATGKCVAPQPAGSTKLNVNLFLHGIGKAGDNRNPTGDGNLNPNTTTRPVTVEFHNPTDDSMVLSKDTEANYDSASGSFKIENFDLGTTLTTRTYKIRVITKSLRGTITRDITASAVNTLPVMTLTNGDATYDGRLDIDDYNLIQGCVRDFDLPPSDCDGIRAAKADLDDDGTVGLFDLNLFIRELSVQNL